MIENIDTLSHVYYMDFTDDEEALMGAALVHTNKDLVLCHRYKIVLTREDFDVLEPNGWISDNVRVNIELIYYRYLQVWVKKYLYTCTWVWSNNLKIQPLKISVLARLSTSFSDFWSSATQGVQNFHESMHLIRSSWQNSGCEDLMMTSKAGRGKWTFSIYGIWLYRYMNSSAIGP